LFPAIPLIAYLSLAILIAISSKTNFYTSNKSTYIIGLGLIWIKQMWILILSRMTKDDIYLLEGYFIGPLILLLNQFLNVFPESSIFYFVMVSIKFFIEKLIERRKVFLSKDLFFQYLVTGRILQVLAISS